MVDLTGLKPLLDFLNALSVGSLLFIIIVGLLRVWWVPGWLYRDLVRDRDEWKSIALRGAHLAERALETPPPPK